MLGSIKRLQVSQKKGPRLVRSPAQKLAELLYMGWPFCNHILKRTPQTLSKCIIQLNNIRKLDSFIHISKLTYICEHCMELHPH